MSKERKFDSRFRVKCHHCGKDFMIEAYSEDVTEFYYNPNRRNIQDIFPYLSAEVRELLISGTCDECWNKMFSFDGEDLDCEEHYEAEGYVSVAELREEW